MADEEAWSAWRGGAVKQVSQHPASPRGFQELRSFLTAGLASVRWSHSSPGASPRTRSRWAACATVLAGEAQCWRLGGVEAAGGPGLPGEPV